MGFSLAFYRVFYRISMTLLLLLLFLWCIGALNMQSAIILYRKYTSCIFSMVIIYVYAYILVIYSYKILKIGAL